MHNAAFQEHGIDAVYELRELEPEDVPGFVAEARGDDWLGFQVTAPYKRLVMDLLDEVEEVAGYDKQGNVVHNILERLYSVMEGDEILKCKSVLKANDPALRRSTEKDISPGMDQRNPGTGVRRRK